MAREHIAAGHGYHDHDSLQPCGHLAVTGHRQKTLLRRSRIGLTDDIRAYITGVPPVTCVQVRIGKPALAVLYPLVKTHIGHLCGSLRSEGLLAALHISGIYPVDIFRFRLQTCKMGTHSHA